MWKPGLPPSLDSNPRMEARAVSASSPGPPSTPYSLALLTRRGRCRKQVLQSLNELDNVSFGKPRCIMVQKGRIDHPVPAVKVANGK